MRSESGVEPGDVIEPPRARLLWRRRELELCTSHMCWLVWSEDEKANPRPGEGGTEL